MSAKSVLKSRSSSNDTLELDASTKWTFDQCELLKLGKGWFHLDDVVPSNVHFSQFQYLEVCADLPKAVDELIINILIVVQP
jgi:hypothetical protein